MKACTEHVIMASVSMSLTYPVPGFESTAIVHPLFICNAMYGVMALTMHRNVFT